MVKVLLHGAILRCQLQQRCEESFMMSVTWCSDSIIIIKIFNRDANFSRKCFTEGSWVLQKGPIIMLLLLHEWKAVLISMKLSRNKIVRQFHETDHVTWCNSRWNLSHFAVSRKIAECIKQGLKRKQIIYFYKKPITWPQHINC